MSTFNNDKHFASTNLHIKDTSSKTKKIYLEYDPRKRHYLQMFWYRLNYIFLCIFIHHDSLTFTAEQNKLSVKQEIAGLNPSQSVWHHEAST